MSPIFLVTEQVFSESGEGQAISLDNSPDGPLQLTLGITQILQQENVEVSVWGSTDRREWSRIASFPHKSYCGTYSMVLGTLLQRNLKYLKARWSMERWASVKKDALVSFYLLAEDAKVRVAGVA